MGQSLDCQKTYCALSKATLREEMKPKSCPSEVNKRGSAYISSAVLLQIHIFYIFYSGEESPEIHKT